MKYHKPKYTRERLVFRYVNALERGDLETVGVILEQAEQDAELERMILEVNDFYVLEQQEMIDAREALKKARERMEQK